jgi:integrase
MAAIVKRRGKWVYDHRDVDGIRRSPSFATYAEAEAAAKVLQTTRGERRRRRMAGVDPGLTFAAWADRWLRQIAPPALKPRAYQPHADAMARHLVPALGTLRLTELRRGTLRDVLLRCQRQGRQDGGPLAPGSVRQIYSALRACLQAAVEDELLTANPAARLGGKRGLRLEPTARQRQERVEQRVLEPEQATTLLTYTRSQARDWYALVLTYLRAGLRLGEALALEITDFHPDTPSLHIRQAQNKVTGKLETPKHGSRVVDLSLSPELVRVLRVQVAGLKKHSLKTGQPLARWLFPSRAGTMVQSRNMARAITRLCARAGLGHHSPHDLRHTYATLLVRAGCPLDYVQRQLGHASIEQTMEYARTARTALPAHLVGAFDEPVATTALPAGGGSRH